MKRVTVWAILPMLMLIAPGCTLKGTIKEITDTTSNITGTTSGRTWFTEDGLLHPEHKLTAFTALNQMNVEQDLARGHGEYVDIARHPLGTAERPANNLSRKGAGSIRDAHDVRS